MVPQYPGAALPDRKGPRRIVDNMKTPEKALRMKVSDPHAGKRYCTAVITFDDTSEFVTPISDFTDLRGKASDYGLDMGRDVVVSPATISWLKNQEGWPDSETVGKV